MNSVAKVLWAIVKIISTAAQQHFANRSQGVYYKKVMDCSIKMNTCAAIHMNKLI